VLPIGGLKEKLLAAHRGGITTVLIPCENEKDLAEIPANIKDKLDIRPVKWIDEVLELALERSPLLATPVRDADGAPATPLAPVATSHPEAQVARRSRGKGRPAPAH